MFSCRGLGWEVSNIFAMVGHSFKVDEYFNENGTIGLADPLVKSLQVFFPG